MVGPPPIPKPSPVLKLAAHAQVCYRYDGERRVRCCPHCDEKLKDSDIYTDAKGWKFCRKCFRKGKGPIKMAMEKESITAGMVRGVLNRAVQGGADPGRLARFMQRANSWASNLGVRQRASAELGTLSQQAPLVAAAKGANPELASKLYSALNGPLEKVPQLYLGDARTKSVAIGAFRPENQQAISQPYIPHVIHEMGHLAALDNNARLLAVANRMGVDRQSPRVREALERLTNRRSARAYSNNPTAFTTLSASSLCLKHGRYTLPVTTPTNSVRCGGWVGDRGAGFAATGNTPFTDPKSMPLDLRQAVKYIGDAQPTRPTPRVLPAQLAAPPGPTPRVPPAQLAAPPVPQPKPAVPYATSALASPAPGRRPVPYLAAAGVGAAGLGAVGLGAYGLSGWNQPESELEEPKLAFEAAMGGRSESSPTAPVAEQATTSLEPPQPSQQTEPVRLTDHALLNQCDQPYNQNEYVLPSEMDMENQPGSVYAGCG